MIINVKGLRRSALIRANNEWFKIGIRQIKGTMLEPLVVLMGGATLWIISLQGLNPRDMNDLGLLSILPSTFYIALGFLIINANLAIYHQQTPGLIRFLYLALVILILHGTPIILYGTLRYSWAWKHVGIVDYIQRYGRLDPDITFLSVYHNWPGFFTLNALLTEVAGFDSALNYASWSPVFFNLLNMGGLWLIFTSVTTDRRLVWLSLWFFYLTSWVGQDYFAPQALNYFLHLIILGVCLRWFRMKIVLSPVSLKRWLRFDRVAALVQRLLSRADVYDVPQITSRPLQQAGLMLIIILIFMAVASSHQLTPIMTILSLMALVIFQQCSARSLPILASMLTVIWIAYMAEAFTQGELSDVIASIGQLGSNLDSSLKELSIVSPGQQLVALMARGLTVSVWGLALLGVIRRLRHGYLDLSIILLAGVPFAMLGGNSYGGEILFRIYLFSLPFMVFLGAALLYPSPALGKSWAPLVITIILSAALLIGFLFAYYGKEQQYYFTPQEVAASEFLYSTAPPGSLLIEGARNYPSQFRNYEHFKYVPLANEAFEDRMEVIKQPVEVLSRWMSNPKHPEAYLILTRSQKIMNETLGIMPVGSFDSIEEKLIQSGQFKILYGNEDARIYILAKPTDGGNP